MSQDLLRCLSLAENIFSGSPAAVFLLENRSQSSKFVSIEIDQNTKVQAITSTIDRLLQSSLTALVLNVPGSFRKKRASVGNTGAAKRAR